MVHAVHVFEVGGLLCQIPKCKAEAASRGKEVPVLLQGNALPVHIGSDVLNLNRSGVLPDLNPGVGQLMLPRWIGVGVAILPSDC